MPEHEHYCYIDTNISSTCTYISTSGADYFELQMEDEYRRWKQECEQQDRIYEQQMEEERQKEEQLKKDKRKYPLFFLKDGIV